MSSIINSAETVSNGFLCDYVEVSSKRPSDRLNGFCIINYGGQHCKCTMRVHLKNGYREGEAVILNDGVPHITLHYEHGLLTGIVERMNDLGMLAMHGHLVSGIESGLFEEYDNSGKVIWRGYYRNGKRYLDVRGKIVKKGRDDERSRETEEYFELNERGEKTRLCIYEKGVMSRIEMEFHGNEMTEFNKNGTRVYEGEYKGDMEMGFVREGKGREYEDGELAVYAGEWRNGKREGLGTEYVQCKPLYSGEWKDGMRHGNGREMDVHGNLVKIGRWSNGVHVSKIKLVVIPASLTSDPVSIEELICSDDSFNLSMITVLKLTNLVFLKRIRIGNYCFKVVVTVEICGLSVLEEVAIGERSFTYARFKMKGPDPVRKSVFRIADCMHLRSIQIGNRSCSNYRSFELRNLPSLQTVEIGESCFFYTAEFALRG